MKQIDALLLIVLLSRSVCGEFSCQNALPKKKLGGKINLFDLIQKGKSLDLFSNDNLRLYAPTSSAVENEECRKDSAWYKKAVKNGELWALRMLDASSKLPDGVFKGNAIMLGNYDECLEVEDITTDTGKFSGQHCMVSIGETSIFTELDFFAKREAGIEMKERFPNNLTLGSAALPHLLSQLSFTWSVCIPSSCSPRDLERHLRRTMRNVLRGGLENVPIAVSELACNSRAKPTQHSWRLGIGIVLLTLYLCVVLVSTSYDLLSPKPKPGRDVRRAFSVYSHYVRLMRPGAGTADNMAVLDGVRALSVLWVVAQHRAMFTTFAPAINHDRVKSLLQDWAYNVFSNGSLCTDSFFLLSGTLVAYNYLKRKDMGAKFTLVQYYVYRYARMAPLFAVVIGVVVTLAEFHGDGPFWKANIEGARANCEKNWWLGLLYLSNYIPFRDMCIGQTWYLSADMQLYWISPLILYPLWKWPRAGKALLGGLILVGLSIAVLIPYVYQFRVVFMETGLMGEKNYFPTHARFTPWLIGVCLGLALRATRGATVDLSRITLSAGWTLSGLLMAGALYLGNIFVQPDYVYHRLSSSLYIGLMRPAWTLGLAWLIFACTQGYGGRVNAFLSSRVFLIVSRLSYSMFFTHISVMMHLYATVRTAQYISVNTFFNDCVRDMVLSVVTGLGLHLTFEAPLSMLQDIVLSSPGPKEKKKL